MYINSYMLSLNNIRKKIYFLYFTEGGVQNKTIDTVGAIIHITKASLYKE